MDSPETTDNAGALAGTDADDPSQYPSLADAPDYSIPLEQDERDRLGRRICQEITRFNSQTLLRRTNLQQWRQAYEMTPPTGPTPWEGAAAVPSSFTRIYCQAASTRLNQQIVQAKPPMAVVAREPKAIDAAPYIEDAMEYVLDQAEWAKAADDGHTELPIAGNVYVRTTYEQEYRPYPEEQVEHDEDRTLAHAAAGGDAVESMFEGLETDERGRVKRSIGWQTRLVYSGVKFKIVPWQDGVILPATVRDSRDAYGIGERVMIRGDALKDGAKTGKYIATEVEELLRRMSDDPASTSETGTDRWGRLQQQGITPDAAQAEGYTRDDEEAALYREYECYDLCWQGDWNDDDALEWAWVTVHFPTERVLRLQYLPYEHGEPCYTLIPFLPRVGELFGAGIAEIIAPYQDASSAILCQLINHNDLSLNLNGNFFYTKSSGLKPDKIVATLGQPTPVDDIDGVKPYPINPLPAEAYELDKKLKEALDLTTASSNPSLGQVTDSQKTLGEVQIVSASANMMFEEMASRVARHWKRVWDQARWLVAQYGDGTSDGGMLTYRKSALPGHKITVTQTDPETGQQVEQQVPAAQVGGQMVPAESGQVFQPIPAEMLKADVDLVPTGLNLMSDMQSSLARASQVMNVLQNHPLTAQLPQVQLLALQQYLQAFKFPVYEKVMAAIEEGMVQQAQAQQQAQSIAQAVQQALASPAAGDKPQAQAQAQTAAITQAITQALLQASGGPLNPAPGPPEGQQPPGAGSAAPQQFPPTGAANNSPPPLQVAGMR